MDAVIDSNEVAHLIFVEYDPGPTGPNRALTLMRYYLNAGTNNSETLQSGIPRLGRASLALSPSGTVAATYAAGNIDGFGGVYFDDLIHDPVFFAGRASSLDFDADGNPHLVFYGAITNELFWVHRSGGAWITNTFAKTTWPMDLHPVSMQLDRQNHPHVVYVDNLTSTLEYGKWTGVTWVHQPIVSLSNNLAKVALRLDAQDRPHVMYFPLNATGSVHYWEGLMVADVGVSVVSTTTSASVDYPLSYTISVSNNGPAFATGVVVTNALPASLLFVDAIATIGLVHYLSGAVTWTIDLLDTDATLELQVLPVVGGFITNSMYVSSAGQDSELSNNTAISVVYVKNGGSIAFGELETVTPENNPVVYLPVYRSGGQEGVFMAEYVASNVTAVGGADYQSITGTLIFADGQVDNAIVLGILDDVEAEGEETFTVTLRNAQGGKIGLISNMLVRIQDNDVPGVLNIVVTNITTDEASGQVVLRVERSQGAVGAVSVDYTTINGTATAGSDYTQTDGTLHFAASEFNRSVVVSILQDTVIEGTERFSFKISNPSGGALLGVASNAIIDISDDDLQVQFSAAEFSATESAGNALVKVKRSGDLSVTSRIDYATVNATAISGSDYIYVSGTLTFEPGQTELTIAVPMINDDLMEGTDESFLVRLFNPSDGTSLGKLHESRVWIRDNDRYYLEASFDNGLPPGWKVKVNGHPRGKWRFDRPEGAAYGRYAEADSGRAGRVKMDTELISPVMNLEDVDTFWLNFSQAWGLVLGGKERLDVDVSVNGQSGPWVNVIRQTPQNYIFSDYITTNISTYVAHQSKVSVRFRYHNAFDAQYWIIDNVRGYGFSSQPPTPGRLRIGSARTVRENAWGVQVDILREGGSSGNIQMDVNTINGTATEGQDFTGFNGVVALSSGQENATVYIRLHDDALIEGTETFSVQIGNPTGGATLSSPSTVVITIIDDEGLLSDLGVSLTTPTDPLLKNATWPMTLVVSNNGPSAASQAVLSLELPPSVVTVHTNLTQGSASLAGSLFTWNVGGLNPYQSAQVVITCRVSVVGTITNAVSVIGGNADTVEENDRLHVTNEVRSAGIIAPGAVAYIIDESAGQLVVDIVRSEDALGAVSVEYETIPGTAQSGVDYVTSNGVLQFADGDVSRPVVISLIDDMDLEGDEFFYIQLHTPEGAELGSALAAVTLHDDEVLSLQSVEGFDAIVSSPGGAGLFSSQGFWIVITNSGSSGWRFDDPGQRGNLTGGSGAFAIADSDWFDSGAMDTVLVSPNFYVGDLSRAILSFATDVSGTNGAEAVVMISTDGMGSNWEWLWSSKGDLVEGPETIFLDVTELFGPQTNVMFSFRYFNATNDGWWQVDDVKLLGEVDSDGDGLPDWWETLNFKNLAQSATNDYDADGVDNLMELLADTSPTNAASLLEIQLITVVSNRPGIRFETSPQRLYDIDASLELHQGWNSLETSIPGSGLIETIMLDTVNSNRMFRIQSRGY